MLKTTIRYAGYPFLLGFPLWLFSMVLNATGRIHLSFAAAVVSGLAAMLVLESMLPAREAWKPRREEARSELKFVFLFLACTETLRATAAALVVHYWGANPPLSQPWFQTWPLWAQVLFITAAADFLRYWQHRAMHKFPALWRVHSVHHSVEKLFMLNSMRMHPIEVALLYSVFTLPFLLLGLDEEALALGMVIHATMSAVEHTNIDFRFGILNKVLSTPALHRWHHSRMVSESNANFSPVFCIWDIVFGTYRCPKGVAVKDLGIQEEGHLEG